MSEQSLPLQMDPLRVSAGLCLEQYESFLYCKREQNKKTERQVNKKFEIQTDRGDTKNKRTERQKTQNHGSAEIREKDRTKNNIKRDRKTEKQKDRETQRQLDRETEKQGRTLVSRPSFGLERERVGKTNKNKVYKFTCLKI